MLPSTGPLTNHTCNLINQSPVVAPVDAWVRCSKLLSLSSLTTGSLLFNNMSIKNSSLTASGI